MALNIFHHDSQDDIRMFCDGLIKRLDPWGEMPEIGDSWVKVSVLIFGALDDLIAERHALDRYLVGLGFDVEEILDDY